MPCSARDNHRGLSLQAPSPVGSIRRITKPGLFQHALIGWICPAYSTIRHRYFALRPGLTLKSGVNFKPRISPHLPSWGFRRRRRYSRAGNRSRPGGEGSPFPSRRGGGNGKDGSGGKAQPLARPRRAVFRTGRARFAGAARPRLRPGRGRRLPVRNRPLRSPEEFLNNSINHCHEPLGRAIVRLTSYIYDKRLFIIPYFRYSPPRFPLRFRHTYA